MILKQLKLRGQERGRRHCAVALLLITCAHVALLSWQSFGDSAWWDEVGHFASGLLHWRDWSFDAYRVNPPLVRLVAMAPVAATAPKLDLRVFSGSDGNNSRLEFNAGKYVAMILGRSYFHYLSIARLACIPFSLLGMFVCYAWAKELYNENAGLLAFTLWAMSPSILAYAHVITPDAGATALGLTANYLFWKWLKRPGWYLAVGMGIVLGAALLSKTTWMLLLVLWPLMTVGCRLLERRTSIGFRADAMQLSVTFAIAIWAINICYGFEGSFERLDSFSFTSRALAGTTPDGARESVPHNRFRHSMLGALPVLLPANYLLGIDYIKMEYERKYWSFLRGEHRNGGWWYYYLYAMLIKEPEGTWILGGLALLVTVWAPRIYNASFRDEIVLLLPALAVLILVSSQTGFNHSLRYVLPAFPFLFIWISKVARSLSVGGLGHRLVTITAVTSLGWATISSVSVIPHSLSYFNALSGGPKKGYTHLGHSNTDWGQDLLYLRDWYMLHPEARPFYLNYALELIDPKMLDMDCRPVPLCCGGADMDEGAVEDVGPKEGWYAISVNSLQDVKGRYNYFNEISPVDWVGYTLPIYHISLQQANAMRVKRGLPLLPS